MKHVALLAVAACGGSAAKPDAAPADALESTGSVTVIVTERGNPISGLPVFFRSLDGATTFQAVTSLEGSSGFDLADGFVTVLLPRKRYGIDRLYTYAGVKANDKLLLELEPRGPDRVELTVDLVPDGTATGPFKIYSTCEQDDPPTLSSEQPPVTLGMHCRGSAADMLAVRIDPDSNQPLTSQRRSVPLDGDRTVTFDAGYDTVANIPVQYTNTGAFTFVHTTQRILTSNGRLYDSFDGGVIGDPNDPVIVSRPPTVDTTTLLVSTAYPLPDTYDEQLIYTWEPTPPLSPTMLAVDLGQRLPAYVNTGTTEVPVIGTYNAASRELVWSEGDAPETSEMVRARLRFYRDDIPQGMAWTWSIVAPRTSPAVRFPELPVQMPLDLDPAAADIATVEELTNLSLPDVPGFPTAYDAVRPRAFGDINRLLMPTTGTLVVQRRFMHEP